MPQIIDISVPVKAGMLVWPKSQGVCVEFNPQGSTVSLDVHSGTHIDAPLHFIPKGIPVDKLKLENMIGSVFVAFLPGVRAITSRDLDNLDLPKNSTRLLLKTANSEMPLGKFRKNFVGLTPDAAYWIARRNIQLVGTDYLSVAQFDKQPEVHEILLKKEVILLGGLNLAKVKPGNYQLICLPIKLVGTEAAPVRAVLLQ